jgi:hypothetical protein
MSKSHFSSIFPAPLSWNKNAGTTISSKIIRILDDAAAAVATQTDNTSEFET